MKTVMRYGQSVGLAFQIMDDILDETAPVATLGKTPGKDRRQGKATYPGVHGIESSRTMIHQITADARDTARQLGPEGRLLIAFAEYLESRAA
jgi:geranylgeranyl diphosphate synthase type II